MNILTVDEFIERHCGDEVPTPAQRDAIESFLQAHYWGGYAFFQGGRGFGKTTLRRWLMDFLADEETVESKGYRALVVSEYVTDVDPYPSR